MVAATPPVCDFDWPAPDFRLPATDGRTLSRDEIAGETGLLVMFICNHCPFVLAILDKIQRDARDLQDLGIGVAAICSNDARQYPADGFDKMAEMARAKDFSFPYLHDADQSVARAYGAVCTPDFFGFDAGGEASKVFTLVYGLDDIDNIYRRFPGVDGSAFLVAGMAINYQRSDGITLAPVRTGVGLRLGANVGYIRYTKDRAIIPF